MIRFFCQTCGAKVQAAEESAGKSGWCPKCRAAFVVPAASAGEVAQNNAPMSSDDIPAPTAATSNRPASPFDVFGNAGSPPPIPAERQSAPQMPVEGIPLGAAQTHPELEALNAPAGFDAGEPEAFPEVSGKTMWPVIVGGIGAVLVLVALIVVAVGRSGPKSVATDANGAPMPQQEEPKPVVRRAAAPEPHVAPDKPSPEAILDRAKQQTSAKPAVIPKTTGAQQAVFDPAPQIKGSTTRPVDAVVQIKTPAGLLTPVKVDDTVYFAAKDGTFFGIKGDSLELVEKKKLGQTVARLTREGKQLKADVQPNPMTVLEFPDPIDAIDPEDVEQSVEMSSVDGKPVPFAWTQHGSAEKQVVFYQGKYFRPLIGGKTKMLDGGKVTTHQGTPVSGIVMWKIAILPSGPMGYDNTSVYELNEHLRPTNRIINLDEVGRWTSVRVNSSLAGDGKTICFVSAYNNKARMMVWSLDGKQKLREMPVTYNETATTEGRRLVAVGDGYLFCGGELTFLPSGEGAFGQYLVKGAGDLSAAAQMVGTRRGGFAPAPAANKKVQNFTPPVVIGNKLFVGNAAGNVYVFDTSSFSANPGSTGNAAVSP